MRSPVVLYLLASLALATLGASASAQSFPGAEKWAPLPCAGGVMSDLRRDQPGAVDERDLVGDVGAPAGLVAADAQHLYLRLRLDRDPAPGGKLAPFAWGVALSLDRSASHYQLLLVVNGSAGKVEVYRNSAVTVADAPADPADQPAALSYPFATHGRAEAASGSSYGGDPDAFISLAVPWADLASLGLKPSTPVLIWAGSGATASALDGDLACHDGGGPPPRLSAVGGGLSVLDPAVDSDGDGFTDRVELQAGTDPTSAGSRPGTQPPPLSSGGLIVEGGGGCAVAGSGGWLAALPLLLLLLLLLLLVLGRGRARLRLQ